jgi:hypothetical protein
MSNFFGFLSGNKTDNEENAAEVESNGATSGLRVEATQSAETVRTVSERKRAKDKSGKSTFSFEAGNSDAVAIEQQAKILDAILDPKVWRGAVAAPGDMMAAITAKEHWVLSEDERDTLAKTGVATARAFAVTDPKWLALSLFSFSIITIYGGRMVKDAQDRAQARRMMVATPKGE